MPSSDSPASARLLVLLVIALVAGAAAWHNWLVDRHLAFVSTVQFNNTPPETPFQRVRPGFTADASMWIRYATDVLEGKKTLRSHRTDADNAPLGREVHWNTGLIAWLATAGWVTQQATGWAAPQAVERAAVWANLPLFLAFMAGFTWWTWRRAGLGAAVLVACACFGQRWFYEGFLPSYLDHHGLVSAAVAGLLLGILFMGAGWIRPSGQASERVDVLLPDSEADARRAARWSGFWGGFGMWISTASMVIPITIVSVGLVLTALACRAHLLGRGVRFSPAVWRTWGRAGALTSFAFYLLEYFPLQMGWRLEVNHPLYALAWWAGAEFLAVALELIHAAPADRRAVALRLALTALVSVPVMLAPLVLIATRGSAVFILSDSFVARLHDSIGEFLPMGKRMAGRSLAEFTEIIGWKLLAPLCGVVLVLITRRRPPVLLLLTLFVSVLMIGLGLFWQARWGTLAASAELPLTVALGVTLPTFAVIGAKLWRRALVVAVIAAAFYVVSGAGLIRQQYVALTNKVVPPDLALELVNRDIATVLRRSLPEGTIVLFTNPNASVSVGYYGRFQTLGTLYWENHAGLRAAAELICAPTDEAAEAIVRRRGITHIAVISEENFVLGYAKLLRPDITMEQLQPLFGVRLLRRNIPVWLEPLIYTAPRGLPGQLASLEVDLYKVNFQQSFAQAYLNGATLFASRNNLPAALELLNNSARLAPRDPLPLKLRAELHARAERWDESVADYHASIALQPEALRSAAYTEAALTMNKSRQFARAVEFYRRAVALDATNTIALNNLIWRLSTTPDDTVRRPAEALELGLRLLQAVPDNSIVLDTVAAALAANGRFGDAVMHVSRAIAIAERDNRFTASLPDYRRRLAAYETGRPWLE